MAKSHRSEVICWKHDCFYTGDPGVLPSLHYKHINTYAAEGHESSLLINFILIQWSQLPALSETAVMEVAPQWATESVVLATVSFSQTSPFPLVAILLQGEIL